MQQAKSAVQPANLAPAAGAKVVKMQTIPSFAWKDSYPAPELGFHDVTAVRPITWFIGKMNPDYSNQLPNGIPSYVKPCRDVYAFHSDGRHGYYSVDNLDDVTTLNAMQAIGWRFLLLSERARQAVPKSSCETDFYPLTTNV